MKVVPRGLLDVLVRVAGLIFLHKRAFERVCRQDFFHKAFTALQANGIDGDYVEFGCHGGTTFSFAYHESRRHGHRARLWGFDSFQGLPPSSLKEDEHPAWIEGQMATSVELFKELCSLNGLPAHEYEVVPGFYDVTLEGRDGRAEPRNICLAYVDCDMYSSTVSVLRFLVPRLKHGMIVAFDDYHNWSSEQMSGERRALQEAFRDHPDWDFVPYVQYGYSGESFVVHRRGA